MSPTVPYSADKEPDMPERGIQQLRDQAQTLCAVLENTMRKNVLHNLGPLASLRPIPKVSRETVSTFLQFLAGEIRGDELSPWVTELVQQGLGPQSALAVMNSLHMASLQVLKADPESVQVLHPVIEAYGAQFLLSYLQVRERKILVEHERLYRSMNVTIQKQQADLQRRQNQLQTAAEVSHAASSILDPADLIRQVVDLVCERFGLYYAGLFLVDQTGEWTGEPGRWAVLRAGTGEAGRQMVERGHKLEIGGESMIGWCVANQQARIALDVGEEAARFDNPLLPETRSEMALPLISRERVIGAMTIQSARSAAFSDEDITALQTMADQLANAIENARLFEQTQQTSFLMGLRVRELACLNDIGQKMEETLPVPEFLQWVTARIPPAMQYPDVCLAATKFEGQVYGAVEAVRLPRQMVQALRIGGKVVGRVYISYTEECDFLDGESALLGDIVRRVSGYIESRRLFEQTQARAEREHAIREISDQMQRATDMETLMRITAEELNRALGASRTYVRLGTEVELGSISNESTTKE